MSDSVLGTGAAGDIEHPYDTTPPEHGAPAPPRSNAPILPSWEAGVTYDVDQLVVAPGGGLITRVSFGVSRDGYDSTEQALWQSAGGAPSGGASEPSMPLADTAATIDTTTYDNTVTGSGKLTTIVMPASEDGGDAPVLAVAIEGDDFPRWLLLSDSTDGFYMGDGSFDPYNEGGALAWAAGPGRPRLYGPNGVEINVPNDRYLLIQGGGLAVTNTTDADTPGSVVKKMEIFDAAGASLGFIPIYDDIV
jgi:hypothetical protein